MPQASSALLQDAPPWMQTAGWPPWQLSVQLNTEAVSWWAFPCPWESYSARYLEIPLSDKPFPFLQLPVSPSAGQKYMHEQHQLLKMLLFLPYPEPQCQGFTSEDFIISQLYHSHSHTEPNSKNPPTLPSFKDRDAIAHLWLFALYGTLYLQIISPPSMCSSMTFILQNEWGMLLYFKFTMCGRPTL